MAPARRQRSRPIGAAALTLLGAGLAAGLDASPARSEEFRWSMEVWDNSGGPVGDGRFEIGTASGVYESATSPRGACDVWLTNAGGPVLLRQQADDGLANDGAFPLGPGVEHHLNTTPGPGPEHPIAVTWTIREGLETTIIAFEIGTDGTPGGADERCTIRGTIHRPSEDRDGPEADPSAPAGG